MAHDTIWHKRTKSLERVKKTKQKNRTMTLKCTGQLHPGKKQPIQWGETPSDVEYKASYRPSGEERDRSDTTTRQRPYGRGHSYHAQR